MSLRKIICGKQLIITLLLLSIFLSSCQITSCQLEPTISFAPTVCQIAELPSAFPEYNSEELGQEWSKEIFIGDAFAKELDFYRAITAYKRALFLLPSDEISRRLQIEYNILLCYYLGNKYNEVVAYFEESSLINLPPRFPATDNLLILLFDSYQKTSQLEKADRILEIIQKYSPETAEDLILYTDVKSGEICSVEELVDEHPKRERLAPYLCEYYLGAKSVKKAKLLNAILPGAGYYYVGQKKSAVTSFLINTFFTWAAYRFFDRGYFAAGVITTSLELGWYLGGINGAGIEAQEFNNRLYSSYAEKMLRENCLFPILLFQTAF